MAHSPPVRPAAVRGTARLLRGWSAAAVATLLAAGSHTLAAVAEPGHAAHDAGPVPIVWILTLALAGPLCTALGGRRLSWWRLAGGVGASQVLFHGLFSISASAGRSGSAAAGAPGPPGHAGHLGHAGHPGHAHHTELRPGDLAPALDALPGADPMPALGHLSPAMLAAHLLAAVATVLLLRRGERLAARVGELAAGMILRSPGARLARWVPLTPPRRVSARAARPPRRPRDILRPTCHLRGPPEFALAA